MDWMSEKVVVVATHMIPKMTIFISRPVPDLVTSKLQHIGVIFVLPLSTRESRTDFLCMCLKGEEDFYKKLMPMSCIVLFDGWTLPWPWYNSYH